MRVNTDTLLAVADPATLRGWAWWAASYDIPLGIEIAIPCAVVVGGFIYACESQRFAPLRSEISDPWVRLQGRFHPTNKEEKHEYTSAEPRPV